MQGFPGQFFNFCGKLSVEQSSALISCGCIFIGVDSGPMHVANYLRKPLIALFSARDLSGKWYPQGKEAYVLQGDAKCRGCMLEDGCPNDHICMKNISVKSVIGKLRNFF